MSPTNKETADLIRRVSMIGKIPQQAAFPQGGTRQGYPQYIPTKPYDPTQLNKTTQEGESLAAQAAQGGMTFFNGIVRVMNGLGRGNTNLAAGVLPHANNIWDTYKDGFQWGDIVPTIKEAVALPADGAWGFIKGVTVSGIPAAADVIKQVDNRPIYEWGKDVLSGKEFHRAMENLKQNPVIPDIGPLLDDLSRLNDPTFAEARNPFTFGLLNNLEAYGLGWDIGIDPTTYATTGLTGALKGFSRGTSSVIKFRKAGKPANFADIAANAKSLPRPYYGVSSATKKVPLKSPTYTVANTSPLTYIAKEMGRGFYESHARRFIAAASKTTAIQAVNEYNKMFAQGLIGKTDATPSYVEEFAVATRDRVLQNRRMQLEQQGISEAEIESYVAETTKMLDEHATEIAQKAPEWIKSLSSEEAAANIRRMAVENGVTPMEIGAMQVANSTARGLKSKTPAIPRTKEPKFNTDAALTFSRAMETLSDPNAVNPHFGELWSGLVSSGVSEATVRRVFESMALPIGYREQWAKVGATNAAQEMSATQDIIRAMYDLPLNPSARRSRKIAGDVKTVQQHIKGTKKTRTLYKPVDTKELRQLMKMLRMAKDTRQGAGSKLTASKKKNILTAAEMDLAQRDFLNNLAKNYYQDVIKAAVPGAQEWDNLLIIDKLPVFEKILLDPSLITSEIFQKSITSPTLLAARVQYLVERALAKETPEFALIETLTKGAYNPNTIQAKHPQMHSLIFDAADKKPGAKITFSEVLKLTNVAAGRIYDRELNRILFNLKVNRASLHTPNGMLDGAKLEEILNEAHTAIITKKRAAFLKKLQADPKANNLVDPVQLNADVEEMLGQHIANLQLKGTVATEQDIKIALEKLADIQVQQMNARQRLTAFGFDFDGTGMPAFEAMTKIDSPRAVKVSSEETKRINQIKKMVAKPTEQNVDPLDALKAIKTGLENILGEPGINAEMRSGIEDILNGTVNLNKAVTAKAISPEVANSYFSLIGSIVKKMTDRTMSGTTLGFDTVFSKAKGEYDTIAVNSFLSYAYRASKSQDSLDGGYFAEQIELMHKKASGRNAQFKPLSEQSPEELQKSLSKIGDWNGAGISPALLQTMIRFTEKRAGRTKLVDLTELEKADIARSEEKIINSIAEELIARDSRIFRVETQAQGITLEDFGKGRGVGLSPEIVAKLKDDEKQVYTSVMESSVSVQVDVNGETVRLLREFIINLFDAGKAVPNLRFTGSGPLWSQIKKLNPNEKGFTGKVDDILATLKVGDEISSEPFRKLYSEIQANFGPKSRSRTPLPPALEPIKRISGQIGIGGWTRAQNKAIKQIEMLRARKAAKELYPQFAAAQRMESAASKTGDKTKAGINWRARAWLATIVVKGDSGIREIEKNNPVLTRLQKIIDVNKTTELQKQKEKFNTLIKNLIDQYQKQGYKGTKTNLNEIPIEDLISEETPIDFLRKVSLMKVTTKEEMDAWDTAMQHLLNMTFIGKEGEYSSFAELIKSYRTAGRTAKPGDISSETGKRIPTDREVLQTLLSFESTISERAQALLDAPQVKRETVLTLLRRLDKTLQKEELDQARSADLMGRIHAVGSDAITAEANTLPDPKITQQEMLNQMAIERVKLYDEGLSQVDLLLADMTGAQNKQFIIDRFKLVEDAQNDLLGKVEGKQLDFSKEKVKWSYETTSINLTGWSRMVSTLSSMAKTNGFEELGDPRRIEYMTTYAMRLLRLRDLNLHISGIFPSTSWSAKRGEGAIVGLGYSPEEMKVLGRPAYLTEADVLDTFEPAQIGQMLFIGPSKSIPITSFIAPAHLLVNAMDLLKPGMYFGEEELKLLQSKMAELMRNDMKHSFISKDSNISHYALNSKAFEENIATIVGHLTDPTNAYKLFQQHVTNGAFALKAYQYKSGVLSKPILEALGKMFENPFNKSANKIDAILKATEDLRAITGREDISEEVKFQAELDLNTVLSAYMDRDSISIAREALRIEAAQQSAEGRAILATQAKSAKGDLQQRINQIRLQMLEERDPLYINLAGIRNLDEAAVIKKVEKDDPFDVFNEHLSGEVQINWTLKFAEKFGRTMFDFGMEELRPLYGPVERRRVLDVSEFEYIGANLAEKWRKTIPNRNVLGEAWQIIQRVPDEILATAINARKILREAERNVGTTGEKVFTPDQYAELKKNSDALNEFLSIDDPVLNQVIQELWAFGGHIFSGGEKSLIKRYGLTPQWLNRSLREIGGGTVRKAIDEEGIYTPLRDGYGFRSEKSMADIWKEWEIDNPVEMIVTMNAAIKKAQLIPTIADDAVRKYGVPKSNYRTYAAAKADGLVEVKTVDSPKRGRELVHFMDTENYYYPIEIAQELGTFSQFLGELKHMQGRGALEKFVLAFGKWTNFTKALMTIFRPGNYIQNAEGSVWANYFAGVDSPIWYQRSLKIMRSMGVDVKDLDVSKLEELMMKYEAKVGDEGFVIKSKLSPDADTTMITINGKAYPFSNLDLAKMAKKYGVHVPVAQNREMDLVPSMTAASSIKNMNNIVKKKAVGAYDKSVYWAGKRSAERDDFFRLALFLKELSTHNWSSLEAGARAAMKKVDRYHPQVQDLSTPLQKSRPFLMFITWRSKMTAVVMGDIMETPGKMLGSIRLTQAYNNSSEQSRSDTFGNLTPASLALPEDYKYNMDPIYTDPTTGQMSRFSVANPVTDLFGSNGLLTKINFNTYEPIPQQIVQVTKETLNQFTINNFPWILKAAYSWPQGINTNGQKIETGPFSTFQDAPGYLNDFMIGAGLNPVQQLAIATFPWLETGIAKSPDQQWAKAARVWMNFLTGAKVTPLDTIQNRNRGMKELLDTLKGLREMP